MGLNPHLLCLNSSPHHSTNKSFGQAEVVQLGYGEAEFGLDEWGSLPIVVIYTDDDAKRRLGPAIEEALRFWEDKLDERP